MSAGPPFAETRAARDPNAIVAMREEHLDEVLAIEQASFPIPWQAASFRAELGHAWSVCRVLVSAGRVVGNLIYWVVADEVELLNIAVEPGQRGKGVARRLLAHLIAHAETHGALRVTLEVRRSNAAAIALYEGAGFTHVAVRPNYYADNAEDALLMQRTLTGRPA